MSDEPSGGGLDVTLRDFAAGQKVFTRYTLIRTLGRGGMGVVWLARDEVLERDVALKFVPELIVLDPAVLNELRRETKRSLELTHKNIVRIYDFVHDPTSACISMEYIDGGTLSGLRVQKENKVFEPAELADWVSQLCDALDYAHIHARIIHRDLKPSNLMVNQRGDLKVADFGIARSLSDSVSMLTHARGTSGTLVYMSPQQLDGERGTHLDDIYSLGVTIYELLTSKPPFYSGNIDRQIREKIAPPMTERRKELDVEGHTIPPVWEQVIASCLAKDPANRPQSVAEVANRLQLEKSKKTVVEGVAIKRQQKKVLVTIAALVLLAVVSVVIVRRQPSVQQSSQVRQITTAGNMTPSKMELETKYDKAFHEFDTNNFPEALKDLDEIDARQPDLAESHNLRGVILMREGIYDKAESAFYETLRIDPKFWNARFNVAEIPFLKKDWGVARARFEELLAGNASDLQGEALQLIQYKILLTYLLEGNNKNMVDSSLAKLERFPNTPAIDYAKAAIALQHNNKKEAEDWITRAKANFSPQLNKLFSESLYEVGWLQKQADEQARENSSPLQQGTPSATAAEAAQPSLSPQGSANGGLWKTFPPGHMPQGRIINTGDLRVLADRGITGQRYYLKGQFVVNVVDANRAILRPRSKPTGTNSSIRIIVEFPVGYSLPSQGSDVNRDEARPYEITEVRKQKDGQLNVFVREIMQ